MDAQLFKESSQLGTKSEHGPALAFGGCTKEYQTTGNNSHMGGYRHPHICEKSEDRIKTIFSEESTFPLGNATL